MMTRLPELARSWASEGAMVVNFAPDGIAIEPNDVNGVTRHLAAHRANISCGLDIKRMAVPIDLS
jgi:hypothetical protein